MKNHGIRLGYGGYPSHCRKHTRADRIRYSSICAVAAFRKSGRSSAYSDPGGVCHGENRISARFKQRAVWGINGQRKK